MAAFSGLTAAIGRLRRPSADGGPLPSAASGRLQQSGGHRLTQGSWLWPWHGTGTKIKSSENLKILKQPKNKVLNKIVKDIVGGTEYPKNRKIVLKSLKES